MVVKNFSQQITHMFSDPWLQRWLPLVIERSNQTPVLEIGCGYGDDTATLIAAGLEVIAFDVSLKCVMATKLRTFSENIICMDLRDNFSESWPHFGVAVASLSLHYFSWTQTQAIVHKIWRSLIPGGVFLCRVNSTKDVNFGAGFGHQVEENFYAADGQMKRFFDEDALDRLFTENWRQLSRESLITTKYLKPKALWELVLEKPGVL